MVSSGSVVLTYGAPLRFRLRVRTGLQKAEHPDEDMPEDDDDEDDDEEIVVRGQKKSYKCPITQTDLVQPVQKYAKWASEWERNDRRD